ncbi:D-3-phosphoglycerate dehydrogenase [Streptoalloteichus tenebrarius]|uniref:D-3-phosphoglycerate dehydrogenase n=1 Tax=Streptoalloteichus tenebrarius (strain ATCC 17920 / DSM 40477 / JCM 4838 / CBS 697.72 / NBRC 16177 / NCIMB 11028 / NRRL B-12390 / A12253. 1 / ISP 5477) TaxID=1933 RepID=A0ABT1HX76_STRSD|nr:2-hydroxyacid dehydrogenase [Streptoalloteichus tenebrarius]MCP2260000.1 D-3-phosphoglycerate dehydrogenase [Streptoalloteichus tenebrarius]BFF03887.1 2-hydroxyacid dehydrogenase [Streptoalloteichus tenebrarius]
MRTTVVAAGDHFVLPTLLADAVRAETSDLDSDVGGVDVRELTLPWPHVPFGEVAEVREASGDEDTMIEALRGARIGVTQMGPLTERVLDACPDLELFCVSRGGPVNVNIEAATRHGVAVCYAPGRNAAATAEHTIALILAAARRIPELHKDIRAGVWRGDYYAYENCGIELEGTTVGLVGYGAIGSRVARALNALGSRVLVHDPYVAADALTGVAEAVALQDLLAQSRIVSLHARVTPETEGMIGRAQIAAMPQGSVLVNCARGALVDYEAVCDALESGHLFGAAFDVFPEEPVPADSRLLTAPNVVLTPHVAGASREVAHKAARIVAAEVGRYLRGEPLAHCANPEVLAQRSAHTR